MNFKYGQPEQSAVDDQHDDADSQAARRPTRHVAARRRAKPALKPRKNTRQHPVEQPA